MGFFSECSTWNLSKLVEARLGKIQRFRVGYGDTIRYRVRTRIFVSIPVSFSDAKKKDRLEGGPS